MNGTTPDEPDLEEELEELQEAVRKLESGDITLQEALKIYEAGREHARNCQRMLEEAHERVMALSGKNGDLSLERLATGQHDRGG